MTENLSNPATAVKDPVCGMTVNPASAEHRAEFKGKSYYFCCSGCADKFKADPEKCLAQPASARPGLIMLEGAAFSPPLSVAPSPSPAAQNSYVCPMCPEVRASKPGPCPTCGMALEPEMPVPAVRTDS